LDKTVVALALHAGDFARPKGGLDHRADPPRASVSAMLVIERFLKADVLARSAADRAGWPGHAI